MSPSGPPGPPGRSNSNAAASSAAGVGDAAGSETQALQEALVQLLEPVARLAVARGLPFAAAQELLKQAFVDAAAAAHPGLAPHRKVSRIATSTGINRREVTRLATPARREAARPPGPTAASQLAAHWRTHPAWRSATGQPMALARLGPAPSFEALAHEITRDVHPRSLLDELCRLGLARLDEDTDTVALQGDAAVPSGDRLRMLGVLGANVGDHLRAAVDNVLASGRPPHLEQALFAEGLSAASLEQLRPLLREQWTQLRQTLVPALEARIEADAAVPGPLARVRLGLYAYQEVPGAQAVVGDPALAPAAVKPRRVAARRAAPKDPTS